MSGARFLSAAWHRVAGLRPKLRQHVSVSRHRYRGESWYVLHDRATGGVHRISPASHVLVAAFDGRRTVDQVWRDVAEQLGEESPSQDDVIHLLGQLGAADLLQAGVGADASALLERAARVRHSARLRRFLNPLVIRKRLWHPDRFFGRTVPYVGWAFSWQVAALWIATVSLGVALVALNWSALSANVVDRILAADNILLMALIYPVLKALHELGHGYALKRFGGAVHEIGVMFLVFFPMPYVDASDAAKFRGKGRRVLVGAAGMLVELLVAALAMIVWTLVEPGFVRAIAFNVMLIAGVSTILFNGNPLLRFDGYYILSDLLEIPNLAQRAGRCWRHLIDRHVFRLSDVPDFVTAPGERRWLLAYAPMAFVYKQFIVLSIALFVASEYLAAGVAIAIWSVSTCILLPLGKAVWQVVAGERYARQRARAVGVTAAGMAGVAILTLAVPAPLHTNAEGVVWLPETAQVRAGASGFVEALVARPGTRVIPGETLVRHGAPELAARIRILAARVDELEVRLAAEAFADRAAAAVTRRELAQARSELAARTEEAARLTVASRAAGVLAVLRPEDLPGRFVREGELIGYVLPEGSRIVRATVRQVDIALVRERLVRTVVRVAGGAPRIYAARIVREVPAGANTLPSKALGGAGGGALPVDPGNDGLRTYQRVFQLDLEIAAPEPLADAFGSRVLVRFEHEWESVGRQAWRRVRQLLLSRLQF